MLLLTSANTKEKQMATKEKEIQYQPHYGTTNEHTFLDKLGTFKGRTSLPRQELLEGYYKGGLKRAEWGKIDRKSIMDRVATELDLGKPWPHNM